MKNTVTSAEREMAFPLGRGQLHTIPGPSTMRRLINLIKCYAAYFNDVLFFPGLSRHV